MSTDTRPYFVHYIDALGVHREVYAGDTAGPALRKAAFIQAGGATDVYLVRKDPLGNARWRAC